MIKRKIEDEIIRRFDSGKAIVIMGARQIGKSTLLHQLFDGKENVGWYDADNMDVVEMFRDKTTPQLKAILGSDKYIVIDEAQRLENAGLTLKRIHDQMPDKQLFATGSSSFELADKIKEAMTGRKWEFKLFPLSFSELVDNSNYITETGMIPHRLVYGYYPDVVMSQGDEINILRSLSSDYLYKDVLKLDSIKRSDSMVNLLKALAFQIGNTVSYNELAQTVGLDAKTVEKYIDLLEQSYIIFRLNSFSRNLRNELKKSKKIYFYDLGIRNAIINNFNALEDRNPVEIGHLWENFLIAERVKNNEYTHRYCNMYFWRTQQQAEIDYIEEYDGKLHTYEFKWSEKTNVKAPSAFLDTYKDSDFRVISRSNIEDFLL